MGRLSQWVPNAIICILRQQMVREILYREGAVKREQRFEDAVLKIRVMQSQPKECQ